MDPQEWEDATSDPSVRGEVTRAGQAMPLGSTITAAVAAVIRDIWNAAAAQLQRTKGWSNFTGTKEVHAIFGYPGAWQRKGVMNRFQEAVQQAGVSRFNGGTEVHFITESEAAAEGILFFEKTAGVAIPKVGCLPPAASPIPPTTLY